MMFRASIICIILLSMVSAGKPADVGGTESPFSLGAGARDLALGGAALTTASNATAPYWNPSALARAERVSLGVFHSRLYDSDVSYQYFGVVVPTLDFGGIGLGVFRLGVDGIERRDEYNLLTGEIQDKRLALHVAYGRMISGYAAGLSVALDYHSIDSYSSVSSPAIGLSIGRPFGTNLSWLPEISASLVGRNLIEPGIRLAQENVSYPRSLSAGLSMTFRPLPDRDHVLIVSGSGTKTARIDPEFSAGLEYILCDMLCLRAAVNDNNHSVGAGLAYKTLSFDYALMDRDLGILHMFSISSAFGTTMSDKRRHREEERERQFNRLLSEQLRSRNTEAVAMLVNQGKEHLLADEPRDAITAFDRALFLSRISEQDTNEIHGLLVEINSRLERESREKAYQEHLDSANARMVTNDHLSAKYFARLALDVAPDSQEAATLLAKADSAIVQNSTWEQALSDQLLVADSLVSYGEYDEALALLRTVRTDAESIDRVRMAMRKAEFEQYRERAQDEFAGEDYRSARMALDSALVRFADHPWCLEFGKRIDRAINRPGKISSPVKIRSYDAPSDVVLREVRDHYRVGRDLFEQGDLIRAVERWEKVERLAPGYMSVREYLVNAYKFLGIEHYGKGELAEAAETWRKAAELDPDNSEIAGYIRRTENEILKLRELTYGPDRR